MATRFYALMGFRFDSQGKVHAAFNVAPCGPYSFELPASKRIAALSSRQQELWAQKEIQKRGYGYHGLHVSDLAA